MMKRTFTTFACLATLGLTLGVAPARATAADAAGIKKCVEDNKDEGVKPPVVAAYCSCMNGKMSPTETLSITGWEEQHPEAQAACSKQAGWK